MKKILKLILGVFIAFSFSSLASCNQNNDVKKETTTEHNYGTLNKGYPATFFSDGQIDYYYCADCKKYFDSDKNEVNSIKIPRLSYENVSIYLNGKCHKCSNVHFLEKNSIEWYFRDLDLKTGDVISIVDIENSQIVHKFEANVFSNITEDYKIKEELLKARAILLYKDNKLTLSVEGTKDDVFFSTGSSEKIMENQSSSDYYDINHPEMSGLANSIYAVHCIFQQKGDVFNIHFKNDYYYTLAKDDSCFETIERDGKNYIKCNQTGWYDIYFNVITRQISFFCYEYPNYDFYLHTYDESGSNQLMSIDGTNAVAYLTCDLEANKLYYILAVNKEDKEDQAMLGEVDSNLGSTSTLGEYKLFQVNESGRYKIEVSLLFWKPTVKLNFIKLYKE